MFLYLLDDGVACHVLYAQCSRKITDREQDPKMEGHRVVVWVILSLFEHTGKDFQSEILLVV